VSAFAAHAVAAAARYLLEEHDKSIAHARDALAIRGGYLHGRVILTAALARSGAVAEAGAEMAEIKRQSPNFTLELINQPYQPDDFADVIEGLRLAGLEEDD